MIAPYGSKSPIVGEGFQFKMKDINTLETIFEGDLETRRCTAHNKSGTQCRRQVTVGLPFCYQHRKSKQKLTVKQSGIPEAGKGLFVNSNLHGPNEIVFRKNDKICSYDGEVLTGTQISERYGNHTAPYALELPHDRVIDASLVRGLGSSANSKTRLSA